MPDFHFRLPLLTIVFRVLKISVFILLYFSHSAYRNFIFAHKETAVFCNSYVFYAACPFLCPCFPFFFCSACANSFSFCRSSGLRYCGTSIWIVTYWSPGLEAAPASFTNPCPADGFWFPTAYPARFCKEPLLAWCAPALPRRKQPL